MGFGHATLTLVRLTLRLQSYTVGFKAFLSVRVRTSSSREFAQPGSHDSQDGRSRSHHPATRQPHLRVRSINPNPPQNPHPEEPWTVRSRTSRGELQKALEPPDARR